MSTVTLYIPHEHHSQLIGPRGSVIRQIEGETGARLVVPKREEAKDAVLLSGLPGELEAGLAAITQVLGYDPPREPLVVASLDVPSTVFGRIIGRGGSGLRRICDESGALVNMPRRGAEGGYVTVKGPGMCVDTAIAMISDVCNQQFQVVSRTGGAGDEEDAGMISDGEDLELQYIDLQTDDDQEECLFFSLFDAEGNDASMTRFLEYLGSAQHSIDVCVFTITEPRIVATLLKAHARGVAVRVITDNDTAFNTGSDIRDLAHAGIPVKADASSAHMHNKFVVLDGAFVMNGSFNWTSQAASANNENVMITNSDVFVDGFLTHFDLLWSHFGFLDI